jgi:hypothetical protein
VSLLDKKDSLLDSAAEYSTSKRRTRYISTRRASVSGRLIPYFTDP